MLVVIVDVWVKPDNVLAFAEATKENATASLLEPGVARFDVVQDKADAAHFVLVEVYRSDAAPAAHKETAHYARWRDTVEPFMARPRSSLKFDSLHPDDEHY
jgi:(4S)-4-hydroxy-5-phosphonooxypentane-2,3-dione isomerase